MVVWYLLSINTTTARAFQNQVVVLGSIKTMINRGVFWNDISSSLISVTAGFALGFALVASIGHPHGMVRAGPQYRRAMDPVYP